MAHLRELFDDYCEDFQKLAQFFPHDPRDIEAAVSGLGDVRHRRFTEEELDEIKLYNKRMNCGNETLANIDKLGQKGTFAIVTGQQPGIFTGPLYTIYKTITAIKLAKHVTEKMGVTAVPVFWNASEDHDFKEVRHIEFANRDNQIISLIYEPQSDVEGKSIFDVPLEPSLGFLIDLLERDTNETEFKSYLIDLLRNSLGRCYSLADWFSHQMQALFASQGLIIVDAHLPPFRQLARPVIGREIKSAPRSSALINKAGARLEETGYHQQIERKPDDVNFFLYAQGRRNKVRTRDGKFIIERLGLEYDQTEMLDMLASEPERFSPSAALRPLVQDHILPTLAYVGGPGEISYFAQMREVYSYFDLAMPLIFPRTRAVLVEPKTAKILEKYALDIDDARKSRADLAKLIASKRAPLPVVDSFDRKLEAMQVGLDELRREVGGVDPTLVEAVDKIKRKVGHEMDKLRDRLTQSQQTDLDIVERQVAKLKKHLYPEGKEQERVFNIYPYLFSYGIQLIPTLEERFDIMSFERQVIHV
jgi:bacillithiol biosynthesis cysteine-adding enzyme BshC